MAAARQRLAQAGLVLAAALLAGCGSSPAPDRGATFRLALPLIPTTLDPARAGDLPSLNIAHELYSGLTRFSGTGVVPDLAQSWGHNADGSVWTFHLRKGLRWSDDRPITAQDFRRSWLRALAPSTGAPLAGPDLGVVRGARGYHATGRGPVGVQALDPRTLRVSLQHPIPWLDQLVAHPIAAAYRPDAYSGPFRRAGRLAMERNFNYWNLKAVKPTRLVLTTETKGADAIVPRGLAPPGLPWVQTAEPPTGHGWKTLPTLAVQLLWLSQKLSPLDRAAVAHAVGDANLNALVPPAMPGHEAVASSALVPGGRLTSRTLTLGYDPRDALAPRTVGAIRAKLAPSNVTIEPKADDSAADLVLSGWSPKIFDEYNVLDLFPCGSAFNVVHWCDPSYDALMRRAVRTLNPGKRYALESRLLGEKLRLAVPAVPVGQPPEYVRLKPGVRGFSWSPIGYYELEGMTRS
jgi:ABC-type oligopeptide transport system substrate-binding subunit